ncbi:MAG: alginate export family protein [Desulfuromonadaceae bacterium]|nr:alginate export family protein [Desulfuromonadaceae bacterium]
MSFKKTGWGKKIGKLSGYVVLPICLLLMLPFFDGDCSPAWAEEKLPEKLTFGANLRARYEFQNSFNQKFYGDNPAAGKEHDGFLLGRLRAGFDWRPTEKIHFALWGQNAEAWDSEMPDSAFYNGTFDRIHHPNKDRLELFDAFVDIKDIFDTGLGIKAGRQRIFYGDNRVFGPGAWGNSGLWIWDAVKLSWVFDRGFVDLFYGRTMLHQVNQFSLHHRHGYESFGAYAHLDVLKKQPVRLFIEPMIFTKTDRHDSYKGETGPELDELDSWYWGGRIHAGAKGFEADGTYLRQEGDFGPDSLDAYGYHVMLAYTLPVVWEPRLEVAYSYASGDSDPTDGKRETFDGAFGAKDMMYGRMNMFSWSNLQDLEASLTVKPYKWLKIKGEAHQFKLADSRDGWSLNPKLYRDKTGASGKEVGKEVDLVVTCKYFKDHTLMAGFGYFWPDEFARKVASDVEASWVFLQWEYKFKVGLL